MIAKSRLCRSTALSLSVLSVRLPDGLFHGAGTLGNRLGCLLCGEDIEPVVERLLAHRQAPVPNLQALRADVPLAVDLLFQRLVAKDPGRRHQTMTAVREAFEQCLNPDLALPPVVPETTAPPPAIPSAPIPPPIGDRP